MTPPLIVPRKLERLAGVPHAIPYQGSKRRLAHTIVPLIPEGTSRLLEPFAGSAAISIASRFSGAVGVAVFSDVNEALMRLWRSLLDDAPALADSYEQLWHEQTKDPRSFYDEVRRKFNATQEPHHFLYLLARCVKAAVRYNRHGEFNQGADHRRLGARPAAMRKRLMETSRVMAGSLAMSGDYREVLDMAEPGDVVYMDPPYEGVSSVRDHRYMRGLDRSGFEEALADAVRRNVSFMLSYDGAMGEKRYGEPLPDSLGMLHLHLYAGRSSQATLQGLAHETVESLYLSPALVARLGGDGAVLASLDVTCTQEALIQVS